ncbi:hypothetical protein KAM546c_24690 [Enterobacter roggenkampii]|nr:hypothetical protein KAM546c_24690 [Enterobacter roggenkampii]
MYAAYGTDSGGECQHVLLLREIWRRYVIKGSVQTFGYDSDFTANGAVAAQSSPPVSMLKISSKHAVMSLVNLRVT